MYSTDNFYKTEDGLTLFYRCHEPESILASQVVLCLPGLTRNHCDYETLAKHLAKDAKVICPDMRGRCRSEYDSNPDNYQIMQYVADMWQLLDYESIDDFIIIGTSLGGLMAMVMYSQQPERVSKIVLNDIGAEVAAEPLLRIADYVAKAAPVADWHQAVTAVKAINQDYFKNLSELEWTQFAKRLFLEDADGKIVPAYDPAIQHNFSLEPLDCWPLFTPLQAIPTLLIRGENSDLLQAETVAAMQRVKPDLITLEIKDRGHSPFLNESVAVQAIDHFVAGKLIALD